MDSDEEHHPDASSSGLNRNADDDRRIELPISETPLNPALPQPIPHDPLSRPLSTIEESSHGNDHDNEYIPSTVPYSDDELFVNRIHFSRFRNHTLLPDMTAYCEFAT